MAAQLRAGRGVEYRNAAVLRIVVGFHRVVLQLESHAGARQRIDELADASAVVVPATSVLVRTVAYDERGGAVAVLRIQDIGGVVGTHEERDGRGWYVAQERPSGYYCGCACGLYAHTKLAAAQKKRDEENIQQACGKPTGRTSGSSGSSSGF